MSKIAIPQMPARPLWRIFLAILFPMMLTNALQSASGAIDGIFIGQLLGVNAVAAVSAFFPVMFLLLAIVIGLASGATVLIGQAWGAGDRDRVRHIAGTALTMILLAGAAVSLAGGLMAPQIIRALGTPAAVQSEAVRYARLVMLGTPVIFLLWLVTAMSRGVGDAVSPLKALALATTISLITTPALILGWGWLPPLGIVSAPISTMVAYLIALLWLGHHWRLHNHPLAPPALASVQIRLDLPVARKILSIGIPAAVQMLALAIAEMALLHLIMRYGAAATAIYGAINQVMGWVQLPVMSLGITTSVLAAHAIGAGKPERVGPIVRTGLCLNLVTTGGVIVLAYAFSRPIIGLFIIDGDAATTATGLLQIVLWSMMALGAASVLTGAMRSDGTVLGPTALAVFAILGIEIPAAYLFEARFGLHGIWFAYATTFAAMLLLQSLFYRGIWRRKARQRLV